MVEISVIVPVYKIEEYISRCIDSILNQTFSDFELVLVDDGSPDRCGEICDQYSKIDSRIKVIHQVNSGVSAARNNGVLASMGDYITFIDGDDWIDENYLNVLYELCKNHNAQLSICNVIHSDKYELKTITYDKSNEVLSGIKALEKYGMIWDVRFRAPYVKLIKRDIVIRYPFPTDRKLGEDAACVYKWIYASEKVASTNTSLYYYFQRDGSAVHSGVSAKKLDNMKTYNEMLSFFSEKHIDDLYNHILSASLIELLKYYEICNAEGKKEDADAFQKEFISHLRKWMSFEGNVKSIKRREDIIPLLNESALREDYIKQCMNSMAIHYNYQNYGELLDLKHRLRKALLMYHPKIEENVYAYGSVYPRLTELYWRFKGVLTHFK